MTKKTGSTYEREMKNASFRRSFNQNYKKLLLSERAIKKLEAIAGTKLSLGGYLAAIRQGEEMTQSEFAKLLGISKQNLCEIELGLQLVSIKEAVYFAKKLGYPPDQFIRLVLQ